ncbi:MAG: polyprenyl synthetase family protein [Actinobacteria bacterium]|nr:polyprenyl synthetase family protein [Cyanobacteriota bacterium]MCL5771888.1 polyprenyl synthetase family protein [Actinomycetota bacterium]
MEELPEIFNRFREEIDNEMKSIISENDLPLYDMLRYHMGWIDEKGNPGDFNKGKFLRATLCMLACISTGKDYKKALPVAAAIELIHNFSLIHDDIQDNDIQRRHRPALWYLWGKPQAINAGTAMKVLANLAILRLQNYKIPYIKQIEIFKILNESCLKMLEGQYLDISFEDKSDVSPDDYIIMIERKTASLIEGAILIGAVLNLDFDKIIPFKIFGNYLGIAFQIRDDILGIWGNEDKTGKPHASDIRKKKKSLPVVFALKQSPDKIKKDLQKIYARKIINEKNVEKILNYLETVKAKDFCEDKCKYYYNLAINEIKNLPVFEEYIDSYKKISKFLLIRNF